MGDFFKFTGSFLFWFFSSIGSASMHPDFIPVILGIFVVAMGIYIIYLIASNLHNKWQLIMTSFAGLVGGIVAAASING